MYFYFGAVLMEMLITKKTGRDQRKALLEAGKRMDDELIRLDLKEAELIEEFKHWRLSHKLLNAS